jgi:prepilin-type N-terminal cleavage/methylation domain-containing protein
MSKRFRLRLALRDSSGYSLVELLLVVSLLGIIMGALVGSFSSAIAGESRTFIRATNEENARLALDRLRLDLHCGRSVQGPWQNLDGGWSIQINEDNDPNTGCTGLVISGTAVQWCTVQVNSKRWRLYRDNINECGPTGSLFMVDYVVDPDIWTTSTQLAACIAGQQQWVDVNLLVNTTPNRELEKYALDDWITLRNSPRPASC